MTTTQRRGGGPIPGRQQAHRRVTYDASTGQPWKTGVMMQPAEAEKALKAADLAGLSFAGLVNELVKRLEVDEAGLPVWAAELKTQQEELPKAG
jgi:hypothetical protein